MSAYGWLSLIIGLGGCLVAVWLEIYQRRKWDKWLKERDDEAYAKAMKDLGSRDR